MPNQDIERWEVQIRTLFFLLPPPPPPPLPPPLSLSKEMTEEGSAGPFPTLQGLWLSSPQADDVVWTARCRDAPAFSTLGPRQPPYGAPWGSLVTRARAGQTHSPWGKGLQRKPFLAPVLGAEPRTSWDPSTSTGLAHYGLSTDVGFPSPSL